MIPDDTEDRFQTEESSSERAAHPASSTYKILGEFTDANGDGALGRSKAASGMPIGVEGAVPNTSGGFGVVSRDDAKVEGSITVTGAASANSLSTTNDVSAGGTVSASNDLTAGDDLRLTGQQEVGELGTVVWLGESDVQIGKSTLRKIPYNQVQRDDFGAYNDSEYAFVVPEERKHHVTVNIQWGAEAFGSYSDEFDLYIYLDEKPEAQLKSQHGRGASISKTFLAEERQTITTPVEQFSGGSVNLKASRPGNFMTVEKIG